MLSLMSKLWNGRTTTRKYTTESVIGPETKKFETVFAFPFVKYLAPLNRLKVYHGVAASLVVPSCGVLEMINILPEQTFLAASYIGITGGIVLSLATLPFRNVIGYLYISEDNNHVKISSVNYWGKRIDKVIPAEDWTPIMDLAPRTLDAIYLSPQLADGSKYKLFIKFGNVLNGHKMGQVLE